MTRQQQQHAVKIMVLCLLLIPTCVNGWVAHPIIAIKSINTENRQRYKSAPNTLTRQHISTAPLQEQEQTSRSIISPLSLTLEELSGVLGGKGRALMCWDCFRMGVDPLWYYDDRHSDTSFEPEVDLLLEADGASKIHSAKEAIANKFETKRRQGNGLGKDALRLFQNCFGGSIETNIASLVEVSTSNDGTTKLLVRLQDGFEVETVIIPWDDRKRSTLCVSSQVGCRQGCTFCATGKMGKLRSLTADEILAQVYWAQKACRLRNIFSVDNIVFMGMGEPADNADSVVLAAEAMVDQLLFQLAPRRVTISTVGPSPQAFHNIGKAPVALAWSVHATRDAVRRKLVPTTRHTMAELRDEGLIPVLKKRSKRLRTTMLEFALIEGINDNPEDALDLVQFCQPLFNEIPGIKLTINLIPWNDIRTSFSSPFSGDVALAEFRRPSTERVLAFQRILQENNILCYIRTTRGDDESAACGQLATKKKR